ncbi:hypothetical protein [Actibacterium lipolyticum]|uniref:Uncharacterized protein n=1 Tax=Actibacterium lipolyticum TaxID=1524263 RepID=A0A238KJI7_9RHOB|nr:hypothetical protein [Actibacterium lipolyticum]SMX42999.1 hypothetical protein COL8621_02173 [Actibacterium lipolyticum]
MDAARLLPILGLFLFMMPLLRQTGGPAATAGIVVYIFAVWFVLIILAGLLSRRLHRANGALVEDGQEDDG